MHTFLASLERITFNGDPLQFLLIETTYKSSISLIHQTGITNKHPELKGICRLYCCAPSSNAYHIDSPANYLSAIIIELHRRSPSSLRDFLRIKFKIGTSEGFKHAHVFNHHTDIPSTEFIYGAEVHILPFPETPL